MHQKLIEKNGLRGAECPLKDEIIRSNLKRIEHDTNKTMQVVKYNRYLSWKGNKQ